MIIGLGFLLIIENKKESKDRESIQSSTTLLMLLLGNFVTKCKCLIQTC